MGHFSVTCTVSKAHIRGDDRCVLMLLAKSTDRLSWSTIYKTPPAVIEGKYDGYGRLEEIKETPGTRFLEELSGNPIQVYVNQWLEAPNTGYDEGIAWIHGDVWDVFSEPWGTTPWGKTTSKHWKDSDMFVSSRMLEKSGFILDEAASVEPRKERYNLVYRHPTMDKSDWVVVSDGSFSHLRNVATGEEVHTFRMGELVKALEEKTGAVVDLGKDRCMWDYKYDLLK